jgi:hypothetical protein
MALPKKTDMIRNMVSSQETGLKIEAIWPESGLILVAREDSVSTQASHSYDEADATLVSATPSLDDAIVRETAHSKEPRGVPLIWDTPNGEKTVDARKKPLGVQFRAEFPLKVKREPEGHGKEIGVEVGWILKSVNGIDVATRRSIKEVNDILYREVGEKTVPLDQWRKHAMDPEYSDGLLSARIAAVTSLLLQPEKMDPELPSSVPPSGVPLVWDTPDGERTVHARKKPLGIQFKAEFPIIVDRKPVGHAEEIGIEIGWILKSVNGIDVATMQGISDVSEILYREVGEKTVPVDQWIR